ncbi:Uncharacterized conserved protein, Ntn-hydrolase superfamily [Gemmobacter aquatilis]|uniref:Uncharacterized conserved protein, Ntn-hydrolase superfamily n=1 Tax=Gemmobacter aquatilis TaxID=933059 RepID=A0A1H8H351_9RHOB|nr:DUF1028 domain-containing protein [Gemmobacter aquatilis]SEN50673.1 Uncharacterized conserved protein, Ntn-hydrolase superfamily [Gemmobacter aquatilis]
MTFSLVARCAKTGQFGMVISSSSPAVAARCAHARAGVGVVASQNVTDPALGPLVLDALAAGLSAPEALAQITTGRAHIDYRQILVVDAAGRRAIHSGRQVLGLWGEAQGVDCAAGGNLLADAGVPQAMVTAFEAASGHLGDRLIAALQAGLAAGGEAGPVHSAGLKIVDRLDWPLADLRCDWTEDCPITALATAWQIYKPQMAAYVQRAIDPTQAPSYGVPGDE